MPDNTRTVLIWFNNDEQRLTFAVNPNSLTISRPREVKEFKTIDGEIILVSKGRGLMSVGLKTFLPGAESKFYNGVHPLTALTMLKRWQDSHRPVRLIISDSDINDAFLITSLKQTINEGDDDIGIEIALKEYKFIKLVSPQPAESLTTTATGLTQRDDPRQAPLTYTVKKGDTLWAIATKYYGSGLKWKEIADKNGIFDPRKLQIGKVLTL